VLTLLADPHDDTRTLYREFLEQQGWRTLEATDGRAAVTTALRSHPDAIVAELRLGEINAFELCRIIRSDAELRATAVVVLTAEERALLPQFARAFGATAVLRKPCLPEHLARTLEDLFNRGSDQRRAG
jgi:CheY-like chemotaxis protein